MAEPLRVGVLHDTAATPTDDEALSAGFNKWLREPIDVLVSCGRLDRDVELIDAYALGLPAGTAFAVERAHAELVAQGVLCIVGPAIGDDALVATPLAEAARVPTIHWAGTERARGEYMFQLQVGSHEDEGVLLARYAAGLGAQRVAVVYDRSPIGRRYASFFEAECEVLGLELAARVAVAPLATNVSREVAASRASGANVLIYLGLGFAATAVAAARADAGWDVLSAMNTAGLRGYDPDFGRVIEGWVYVDMLSDDNRVLASLRDRVGEGAVGVVPAAARDLGQLVAEGLARAPELTRDGVKQGLELVKRIPAAEGREGTTLGFGHWDRGALHGEYLVLRQWRDGVSVQL